MDGLDDHLESLANADVLVRAYPCTTCKATETVEEKYEKEHGIFFGQCSLCGEKYLPPDWDAMGKELP